MGSRVKEVVLEVIRNRRSTRSFSSEVPDRSVLEQILLAATWAPSAGNLQPWFFIMVQSSDLKQRLSQAALGQDFVADAPFVIVVCADILRSASRYGKRGAELYCIQDTAAATQNMLLTAHGLGLSSCWVGAFNEDEVREVLNLPDEIRPVALVPLGFSERRPSAPLRRPIGDVVSWLA